MTSYYYNNGQVANPPPGTIIAYLGTTPPDGWMLCDGQSVQRISFPELATALGVSVSDTSFNLPNLQGVFLRGIGAYDISHNQTGAIRAYQQDCIKQHIHKILYTTGNPSGNGGQTSYTQSGTTDTNITFGNFGGSETAPYCYGVNWIIKTDLNPNVPGQPTIISYTVASNTSLSISFNPSPVPYLPYLDSPLSYATTGSSVINITTSTGYSAYSPVNNSLYLFSLSSATTTCTIYNITSNTLSTLSLGASHQIRGVVYAPNNNKIYARSFTTSQMVVVNCSTNIVTTITLSASGLAWEDGAYCSSTQEIVFIPRTSTSVLIINTTNDTARYVTPGSGFGNSNFIGSVYSPATNRVYGVPFQSAYVCYYDVATSTAEPTAFLHGSGPNGSLWNGGVIASNGKIYCAVWNAPNMLVIDPETNTSILPTGLTMGRVCLQGIASSFDNNLYFAPLNASNIICVNPSTNTFTTIPLNGTSTNYGYSCSIDTSYNIYFAPQSEPNNLMKLSMQYGVAVLNNYEYSTNNGITWNTTGSSTSPISISPLYSSVRLRGVNTFGSGQSSGISYLVPDLTGIGLRFNRYNGYFNDNPLWFNGQTIQGTGNTKNITNISIGTNGQISTGSQIALSVQWIGNFLPDISGTWRFYTTSDDASYVWIGNSAYSDYYTGGPSPINLTVNNGGEHGPRERSGTAILTAGVYYPLRIQFGNKASSDTAMQFSFLPPGGTQQTDGTNFFFSPFPSQVFS